MPAGEKIRIRLKAYDHRILDQSTREIVETAKRTGANVAGPIPAAHHDQPVDGAALAACGQEVARAVRNAHAQAPDRHSGTDAGHGGCAHEARLCRPEWTWKSRPSGASTWQVRTAHGNSKAIGKHEEEARVLRWLSNGILGMQARHGAGLRRGWHGACGCTVLQAGPCVVVQRRTKQKDGYEAVQLGLVEFVKPQRVNKPMTGHFKKADAAPMRQLREVPPGRVRRRNQGRRPRSGRSLRAQANWSTSPASARARDLPAASSAGTSAEATPRTARCSTARREALARVRFPRVSGRDSIFRGTWATSKLR